MDRIPLAIIAAMDDEVRSLLAKVSVDERMHVKPARFIRGTLEGRPLVIGRSGIGPEAMAGAIRACLETYHPATVLHVGYCGGADPELATGDLVIADAVIDGRSGRRVACPPAMVAAAANCCETAKLRSRTGTLVTVDRVASTAHEKADLGAQHGALGMDMESAALAAACSERPVPWVVVRSVLDPLDVLLPPMEGVIDEAGETDGIALAEHLVRHPADALKLPRLQYLASQARESIAAFIAAWLA